MTAPSRDRDRDLILVMGVLFRLMGLTLLVLTRWAQAGPTPPTPEIDFLSLSPDNTIGQWTVDICEIGRCISKPPWSCNTNETVVVVATLEPVPPNVLVTRTSPNCRDSRINIALPNPQKNQSFVFTLSQIFDRDNRTVLVQGTVTLRLPNQPTYAGQTLVQVALNDHEKLPEIPVSCTTRASALPANITRVKCPKNCRNASKMVWGSDPYTTDSSICRAGIHMGNVGNDGGTLIVLLAGKHANFTASVRNGVNTLSYDKESWSCFTTKQYLTGGVGNVTLWYNSTSIQTATFVIDFCKISACPKGYMPWECTNGVPRMQGSAYLCVADDYWGDQCGSWGAVGWNTRADKQEVETDWGYKPRSAQSRVDRNGKSLLTRLTLLKKGTCNSLFTINIENPGPQDQGTYLFGSWVWGRQSPKMGQIHLRDMSSNTDEYNEYLSQIKPQTPRRGPSRPTSDGVRAVANPTYEDTLAIETGFTDINLWLEWMRYSAAQHNRTNCYVCGAARPHLGTVPLILPPSAENCFLGLFTNTTAKDSDCGGWEHKYPIITKAPIPGDGFTIYKGNYTCYNGSRTGARDYGTLNYEFCANYSKVNISQTQHMTQSLGDVYWFCGDMKIRTRLEGHWRGTCTLVKALMSVFIFSGNEEDPIVSSGRTKRELKGSFDPHVYIDAIGVPRGVPDEFKARDQVKAGFESLLLFITVNKNVDWINYIYYNQQRFINYTKDALQGIAEQLQADSTMTFQNRMALDMLLAEKGGVCAMIRAGDSCCTYIPENTGPNGKTTVAIKKLTDLAEELKRNSGLDNPWDQYFGWLSNWKHFLLQVGMVILVALLSLCIVSMCIIPCFKKLCFEGIAKLALYVETEPDGEEYVDIQMLPHSSSLRRSYNVVPSHPITSEFRGMGEQ